MILAIRVGFLVFVGLKVVTLPHPVLISLLLPTLIVFLRSMKKPRALGRLRWVRTLQGVVRNGAVVAPLRSRAMANRKRLLSLNAWWKTRFVLPL